MSGSVNAVGFEINNLNPNGEFNLIFKIKPEVKFFGRDMSALQRFRRYGNLPDNNVAANKIINHLGKHLLTMEVSESKIKSENQKKLHQAEKLSNALFIDLFCELSTLEQARFSGVIVQQNTLETKIEAIFNNYLGLVDEQLLKGTLLNKKKSLLARFKKLEFNDKKNRNSQSIREFYQSVLDDYRDVQQVISNQQIPYLGVAETNNSSLTEAYNDASSELEAHKFGMFKPSDIQLWSDMDAGVVSTEVMPNLRKDYALKTYCIDTSGAYKADDYVAQTKNIREENIAVKKNNTQQEEQNSVNQSGDNKKTEVNDVRQLYESFPPNPNQYQHFLREQPLTYFEENDFFSAIGTASLSVGKYFEREVGAKHPLVCLGFFLTASITFTAAGLGAVGVAPALMNKVVLGVSKLLSVGGKIATPEQIAHTIHLISDEWLTLCHAEGKVFQTLVMNSLGLPKLTFLAADSLFFNGLDDKDSISQLAEKFIPQDLTGQLRTEAIEQTTKNIIVASLVLGFAVGVGLGSEQLMLKGGIWAKIGSFFNKISDVPGAVFSDLVNASTTAQKIQAITSLILTIKTAGLLVGKVGLLFVNMAAPGGATQEQLQEFNAQQDAVQMMEVLLMMASSQPSVFQEWINQKTLGDTVKTNFIAACEKYPEIKEKFLNNPQFLAAVDCSLSTKTESSLLSKLAQGSLRILSGLLGLIVSPFYTIASSFSPTVENFFINGSQREDVQGTFFSISKFLSDKFFAPLWGGVLIPFGIIPAFRNTKGFSDGLKLLSGLLRVLIFLFIPIKMILMGLYELIKRSLMFVTRFLFKCLMIINALFNGEFTAAGKGILSAVLDVLGMLAFAIDQIASAVIGVVDVVKSIINIGPAVIDFFHAIGKGFDGFSFSFDQFKQAFNEPWCPSFDTKGFAGARKAYLDEYSLFSKVKEKSGDYAFDLINMQSDVNQYLKGFQQDLLNGISDVFAWVLDNVFSKFAMWFRSNTLRNLEESSQENEFKRLGHDKVKNDKSSPLEISRAVGGNPEEKKVAQIPEPQQTSQIHSNSIFESNADSHSDSDSNPNLNPNHPK